MTIQQNQSVIPPSKYKVLKVFANELQYRRIVFPVPNPRDLSRHSTNPFLEDGSVLSTQELSLLNMERELWVVRQVPDRNFVSETKSRL